MSTALNSKDMKAINTSLVQSIVNAANTKTDKTFMLSESSSRYVVSIQNIHSAKNMSLVFNLNTKIHKALNKSGIDSIGTWTDKSGVTHVDMNVHLDSIIDAIRLGTSCNQQAIYDLKNRKTIML